MNDDSNVNGPRITHFGYQQVPWQEKQQKVAGVFRSVAGKYDVMNDLISMGSHRLLKRMTIELSGIRPGHKVLDLAGGTVLSAKPDRWCWRISMTPCWQWAATGCSTRVAATIPRSPR